MSELSSQRTLRHVVRVVGPWVQVGPEDFLQALRALWYDRRREASKDLGGGVESDEGPGYTPPPFETTLPVD